MKKERKEKKRYSPPKLTRHGKVSELTSAASGAVDDFSAGMITEMGAPVPGLD